MSVISSNFADELAEKEMRDAYLEAQTRVTVAQQIRALRTQRGWSQAQLGDRLGKPQGNVARLEDIEVARYTLTTLLELAAAFDVALCVRFVSYSDFLESTDNLSPEALAVPSFTRSELDGLCEIQATEPSVFANVFPSNVNRLEPFGVFGGVTLMTPASGGGLAGAAMSSGGYIMTPGGKISVVEQPSKDSLNSQAITLSDVTQVAVTTGQQTYEVNQFDFLELTNHQGAGWLGGVHRQQPQRYGFSK